MRKLILVSLCSILTIGRALALVDDPMTLGLWHADSSYNMGADIYGNPDRLAIPDDDSANPGRGAHLVLGQRKSSSPDPAWEPTLIARDAGKALYFDGTAVAHAQDGFWQNQDEFKLEFDLNPDAGTAAGTFMDVVTVTETFTVRCKPLSDTTANLTLYVYTSEETAPIAVTSDAFNLGEWTNVVVEAADGQLSLNVDGTVFSKAYNGDINDCHHSALNVGASWTGARPFIGALDEIKVSNVPEPASVMLLVFGGLLAAKKRK